jgi:cytochrome bd-type quinol oxidase subunit 2|tara:strand:- start:173 stop:388 length:216 start_codon:yes stop_codon:yes gene_type:complete
MIKIIFLTIFIVAILYLLKKKSHSNIYGKLIFIFIILAILFLIATSGRVLFPQILQILKIGIPLITKFIGI